MEGFNMEIEVKSQKDDEIVFIVVISAVIVLLIGIIGIVIINSFNKNLSIKK